MSIAYKLGLVYGFARTVLLDDELSISQFVSVLAAFFLAYILVHQVLRKLEELEELEPD